ncbi:unnamed protein product [Penicillium glandicola]
MYKYGLPRNDAIDNPSSSQQNSSLPNQHICRPCQFYNNNGLSQRFHTAYYTGKIEALVAYAKQVKMHKDPNLDIMSCYMSAKMDNPACGVYENCDQIHANANM